MLSDVMERVSGSVYGFNAFPGASPTTLAPGMGGLTANLAPGVIAPLHENIAGNLAPSQAGEQSVGKIGLCLLGISVLTLVGFNLITKGYHG